MTDELLVQLFYAAQGNITQFRIKARELLADGGKGEAVGAISEFPYWHFVPLIEWERIDSGAKLYTATQAECAPRDELMKVGESSLMPGASAFTMACFEAWRVPVGTKLYAQAAKENA